MTGDFIVQDITGAANRSCQERGLSEEDLKVFPAERIRLFEVFQGFQGAGSPNRTLSKSRTTISAWRVNLSRNSFRRNSSIYEM